MVGIFNQDVNLAEVLLNSKHFLKKNIFFKFDYSILLKKSLSIQGSIAISRNVRV